MDLKELAKARGNVYRFLANLFLEEPSPALLEKFSDEPFLSSLSDIFGKNSGIDLMKDARDMADLELDFSNLFIVPNEKYLKPYESVYLDERTVGTKVASGLVSGESSLAVKRSYKEAGAKINVKELPDHIGLELEFLHFLCTSENWDNKEEALRYIGLEKRFLKEHLLKWVDEFCDNMAGNATTDFYKGLAQITKMFVLGDLRTVNEITEGI